MGKYDLALIWPFVLDKLDEIIELSTEHVVVVLLSVLMASIFGVSLGLFAWNKPLLRSASIATAGVILTIPSMALLALMIPTFGLGWVPTLIALALYSLLPIVRNTVVGLREVPEAVLESAKGMGMSPLKILLAVQMPLAWPVILTGLRVATQLAIGIASIAAYVAGPGLGVYIFKGLSMLGAKNALNFALTGTVMIVIIALLFDLLFVVIKRITTSRGIRG